MKNEQKNLSGGLPALREGIRGEFGLRGDIVFLNHGSFGAVPKVVIEAQNEWRRRIEAEPVEILGRRWNDLLEGVKGRVGEFLSMRPADFGLVTNATEGINAVLRGMEIRPGEELVTTTHVYNAVRQAMKFVAGRAGAGYREIEVPLPVKSGQEIAERVIGGLTDKSRLLVIDHVTSPTALVFPVSRIVEECRKRGVDVLIDGAHAPGMIELDVAGIGAAYYAGNLHKWMCAPKGSGFVWANPVKHANVHPTTISHLFGQGLEKEFSWQGTRDVSAWLSIPESMKFMEGLGWARVRAHNHELAAWAQRYLCGRFGVQARSPLDGSMLGSMATMLIPGAIAGLTDETQIAMQDRLYREHGVEAPLVNWGGAWHVRAACAVYTSPGEIERLAEAILAMAGK